MRDPKEIELQENLNTGNNKQVTEDPYQKVAMTEKSDKDKDNDRMAKLRDEAKALRGNADEELRKNLLFDLKEISIWQLMCHLSEKLDILCMILATIGS